MKKAIALLLICCMMMGMTVSAAAEAASAPTIEEILNEYHQKSFENAQENTSSANARGIGGKTLEQETVDALNAAGYEAYNVTTENYNALEESLKTNFADMNLDPNCSYIIAISGEDGTKTNPNARVVDLPSYDIVDPGIGGGYFTRTYNGNEYRLRYVTVTATGHDDLKDSGLYAVTAESRLNYIAQNVFTTLLVAFADSAFVDTALEDWHFGTLASIFWTSPNDYISIPLAPDSLIVYAQASWTCKYIQIWDSYNEIWVSAQWSEYATAMAYCTGGMHDDSTNRPIPITTNPQYITVYSRWYNDTEKCIADAFTAYDRYTLYFDRVENIEIFFGDEDGDIIFDSEDNPIITLRRSNAIVLPES